MAKYLVAWKEGLLDGEIRCVQQPIKGGTKWICSVVDFDGTPEEAAKHYTVEILYGGDSSAKPEQYRADFFKCRRPIDEIRVFKLRDGVVGNPKNVYVSHVNWHEREQQRVIEASERAELKRLKDKYGDDDG